MSGRDHDNDDLTQPATQLDDWDDLPETTSEWQPGQRVGPFILKRKLGAGGMGMVWLAEQMVPLRREVALKVMLPERRSRLAEAHFEVERQVLARLSHRAIAQIHEAGELPDGGLYFAMEYVPGLPLDHFLEQHPPTLRQLVAMLVEICSGIQHAHQHGLIHRDIKPANILVEQTDRQPQPRIIDFGIAVEGADDESMAGHGHYFAGTLAYMAPEQRSRSGAHIDVRTDVFALGAVLAHSLLSHAGIHWDAQHRFESKSVYGALCQLEATRRSVETGDDPPSEWTDRLATLPTDLRAIVLRAMAPERDDRYQSAAALAEDLQRWLDYEPVRAMGKRRGYRLRCFLRRNALASAAAAVVSLALVGGTITALYGLTEAREGRSQAESALALAEQRRAEAEELIQFMLGDFAEQLRPIGRLDLLDSIGGEALRYLTAQGAGDDPNSALSRARALRTLGEVQSRRQQFEQATDTLARAAGLLEPWHEQHTPNLDELHFEAGQIAFWRGLVTYRQRDWESTETHWLQYMHHARLFAELTTDKRRGREEMTYAYNNLGTLAEARNQLAKARNYFQQTIAMRREMVGHDSDIESIINLANALSWSARVESALGLTVQAWQRNTEALNLVTALRQHAPDHAERRSMEINFRFILARDAYNLGFDEFARHQLQVALPLAEVDVANEPTQPRRQANLARIAFMLATLTDPGSDEATALITLGERALMAASELGLDPQQTVELPARLQLARLHQDPAASTDLDTDSIDQLLDTLKQREVFDALYFNLMEVATSLLEGLTDHGADIPEQWSRVLQARLGAVPQEQQQSLRYRLVHYRLGHLLDPQAAEQIELAARIKDTRMSVAPHIQEDIP
jgi:eukaryotic-like serine/threonine-protein kinase